MNHRWVLSILMFLHLPAVAQTTFCPDDPPRNPWLADSPYPIYHRNNYAQASTCIRGITQADSVAIKVRSDITGGSSPWIYLSDRYHSGERIILFSNSNVVFKFIDNGTALIAIDSLRLDFDVNTTGYNFLLTRNKVWYTYDPAYNPSRNKFTRLYKLTDADTTDPYSPIVVLDTLDFGDYGINKVSMYSLNYRGEIVFYSHQDEVANTFTVGIIDQDLNLLAQHDYPALQDERVNHNSIAVDENNSFYIVTSHRLIQFTWDGLSLAMGWQALYDFVHDGPTGNFAYGSGTTPTLLGWGDGRDKLVVVADGHANNNLVAFWRELPADWNGIPGMDIRFADSISIPYARSFGNLFQSIENSPTAHGYDVAVAQFNGFLGYGCDNVKGVQKFRWDESARRFILQWANNEVNMNGVLCYSSGSNLVYGSGKESDCYYYYYGLDWDTGAIALRLRLGPEETFPNDPFYDQGVNHIIDEDGSIYFSGSRSLIKLERHSTSTSISVPDGAVEEILALYPNPSTGILYTRGRDVEGWDYTIHGVDGRVHRRGRVSRSAIPTGDLPAGIYLVGLSDGRTIITRRFLATGW